MKFSAEVAPGEIVAIFDGNVYPIVGPGENSPQGENWNPSTTTIEGANKTKYLVEVHGHTDEDAKIFFLEMQDELLINFSTQDVNIPRGGEVTFSDLTVLHSI